MAIWSAVTPGCGPSGLGDPGRSGGCTDAAAMGRHACSSLVTTGGRPWRSRMATSTPRSCCKEEVRWEPTNTAFSRRSSLQTTSRANPTYGEMRARRKINHFNVVTSSLPAELSNASDFSRSSVEARIQAGYDDAIEQGIGRVNAPGLRAGVTGAGSELAT